jgi:pyridoxine 4-dehydrogenase
VRPGHPGRGPIGELKKLQDLYNLTNRSSEALLDWSTEHGIGFIPWFPFALA